MNRVADLSHSPDWRLHASPKLVILGRDGILNQFPRRPREETGEWAYPGALEAIAAQPYAGWYVVVASNQSGIGRA